MNITCVNPYLTSFIAGYNSISSSEFNKKKLEGSIIPDGFVELYFLKGNSINFKSVVEPNNQKLKNGFVLSQFNKSMNLITNGNFELFSVKLTPWAAWYILPEVIAYKNKCVNLTDFNENGIVHLQDKILNTNSIIDAIKIVEDFVSQKIRTKKRQHSQLIQVCCNYIYKSKGILKIKELAKITGITSEYIQREFNKYLGITPKQFSEIIRLRNVVNFQKNHSTISLTALAHQFAYFDQAHFISTFKKVTSVSPRVFFQNEGLIISNYQDHY